jgi:hypothetical protein
VSAGVVRAAQQSPVTLDVRAGYDGNGQYHVTHWFPVQVTVANDGGDLRGTIEWRFPGDSDPAFRYDVDLPRGSRKQVMLPVVTNTSAHLAELRLLVNGQLLISRNVRLDPIDTNEIAVGVVSSDQTLLNSLSSAQLANSFTTVLSRLSPDLLPDDAMLLEGLDVIVVHDIATATLSASQRSALDRWVRLGGTLLVSGGPDAGRVAGGLADLLPVELGSDMRANVPVDSIERIAGHSGLGDLLQGITANQIRLRPDARAIDQSNLITKHDVGAGRVIFAAFDIAALRAWPGEPQLWSPILAIENRMQLGTSFRGRSENLVRDTLQLAALSLPSPAILLLLIVIYIVVIGPANFLVLRRMRRVDLAWVTTPILVAIFLVLAYGASFVLRGTRPQVSQLALVQGFEGVPGGQATVFVSVFSPQRRTYTLGFAPDALVSPGTFESFQFSTVPVSLSDSAVTVPDLLIDVSSLRTLLVEQPVVDVPAVQSQIVRDTSQFSGTVQNTSGETLHNALIVVGDAVQILGDVGPGVNVEVKLPLNLQAFPGQVDTPSSGLFNQQQVLSSLFSYDRFTFGGPTFQGHQGLPERDAAYLLAWRDQPAIDVAVDGDGHLQQGMTLYLIRLNT